LLFYGGLKEKGIALFGFLLVVEVKFGFLCDFCVSLGFYVLFNGKGSVFGVLFFVVAEI